MNGKVSQRNSGYAIDLVGSDRHSRPVFQLVFAAWQWVQQTRRYALVAGPGLAFGARGSQPLKRIPGEWLPFATERQGAASGISI